MSQITRFAGILFLLGFFVLPSLQAQQGFTYQAVARNLSGSPIVDQPLSVRIAIYSGSLNGTLVWQEEHDVMTTSLGLFTLMVGDPDARNKSGMVSSFEEIDWSAGPYFLHVWVQSEGEFIDMGGAPIQTVPIAQYATSAKNAAGNFSIQPGEDAQPGEALFEVRRKDGYPVFAVYEDMVWVYVDTAATKGVKGGFAVGGYHRSKGTAQEFLRVTPDSVRVYIDSDPNTKGVKGGFAVGGYRQSKGLSDDIFLNVSGKSAVDVVKDKSQILWYPLKEAFLAGNIHVGSVDSVGQNSTSMGYKSVAMGNYSQAFGYQSMSIGNYSTSFGNRSIARGEDSYALGSGAVASGNKSFAIGVGSTSTGYSSMALGTYSDALANYSTAVGYRSEASGLFSHAFGLQAVASGERSMALGMVSTASGLRSLSMGYSSDATRPYSLAIGANAFASGDTSISLGSASTASGSSSVAIGTGTEASGKLSTAIGYNAMAGGLKSISVGAYYYKSFSFIPPIIIIPPFFPKGIDPEADPPKETGTSKGTFVTLPLFADRDNQALGTYSMALGNGNHAENGGIAIGVYNDAMDIYSTAFGFGNKAVAPYSFAGGFANITEGQFATAFGRYTSAASLNSFAIGTYNVSTGTSDDWIPTDPLFQIGNGASSTETHDAFRVNKNGSTYISPQESAHGLYLYGYNNLYNSYHYSRITPENPYTTVYGMYTRIFSTDTDVSDVYSGRFTGSVSAGIYHGLYADLRSGDAIDVAEYIYDTHGDTEAGDVLVADPDNKESVIRSQQPYQASVLGVVSTDPHMVMGMDLVVDEQTGESIPDVSATRLALTGRVPVKVTDENGTIRPGDLLTTSSTEGHAMKWSLLDVSTAKDFEELKSMLAENERRRNAVIGKAVGSHSSGTGKVMVLISLQ